MTDDKAVWLITGCSTGFGREIAKEALARGRRVVVTARDRAKVEDIAAGNPDALALALDVTDANAIKAAVAAAEERFGAVDVLVNNAGYGYLAAFEEAEEAEVRAMFEANFFGLVAMTKAVVPGMRGRGRGVVVNISSVGGLVGNVASSFYAATKFAVEGASEALAKEAGPLGIKVLLVEPGPFRTDWAGRSLRRPTERIAAYADTAGARLDRMDAVSGTQVGDPVRAAKAIVDTVEAPNPPLRLVLGRPGLEMVRGKLESLRAEIDAWEKVTLSADFPEGER